MEKRVSCSKLSKILNRSKASVLPRSPILVTLMMGTIRSLEMSIITRTTLRNSPDDGILHSHSREDLKPYIGLTGWAL
jgi:hypothetical protein